MLTRLLLFCCLLNLVRAQNGCEEFWQLANEKSGDVYGIVSLPPSQTNEHKLRIKLSVASDVSSVSLKLFMCILDVTDLPSSNRYQRSTSTEKKSGRVCVIKTQIKMTLGSYARCFVGHARFSLDDVSVDDPREDDNEYN